MTVPGSNHRSTFPVVLERYRLGVMEILSGSELRWHMVSVLPNREMQVASKLASKGFEVFLPTYQSKRQWSDRVKIIKTPLFPSYVFCRYAVKDRIAIVRTPGVVSNAGAVGPPVQLSDSDVERMRQLVVSGYALEPAARLTVGQRARLGSRLAGIDGVLAESGGDCCVVVNFDPLESAIRVTVPRELVIME